MKQGGLEEPIRGKMLSDADDFHHGSLNPFKDTPKPLAPVRTSTHSTYPLSSCGSSSRQLPRRRSGYLKDDLICEGTDEDEADEDEFDFLSRISMQYRERCHLMDKRHHQRLCKYSRRAKSSLQRFLDALEDVQPLKLSSPPHRNLTEEPDWKPPPRLAQSCSEAFSTISAPQLGTPSLCLSRHESNPFLDLPLPEKTLRNDPVRADDETDGFKADPDAIREQQKILDDIERRRRERLDAVPPTGGGLRRATTSIMEEDRVARLSNGRKIRVKGTRHTYNSICQGQSQLVQCPGCQTILQVSDKAKLLYCTFCQQVSPICPLDEDDGIGLNGGGMGNPMVASTLQRQA